MGAFALGEIGLLDGRRCTTHWLALDRLRQRFPTALIEPEAIFTEHGPVFTSAGATGGIDLALHLIGLDGGQRLVSSVARALVVFELDDRLRRLVAQVLQDPGADPRVPALASLPVTSRGCFGPSPARLLRPLSRA